MSAREPQGRRARICSARNGETGARCALADTWSAHAQTGGDHETTPTGDGARQAWRVTSTSVHKWVGEPDALVALVVMLSEEHTEHARVTSGCPKCVTDERVQTARDVARAFRLVFDEVPVRLALAGDDLRSKHTPFAGGGLLPRDAGGSTVFISPAPPPTVSGAMLDADVLRARQSRERGQW